MIFLDFDGVLYNTVKEAYAVATISSGMFDSISEVDFSDKHYIYFKHMRPLISPAWNYKYLLEGLEVTYDLSLLKNIYHAKLENALELEYRAFQESFFCTRGYLKENNYNKWLQLNTPYGFLSEIKHVFDNYGDFIYIITTKDKATVLSLLSLDNIKVDPCRIFDVDDYSKYGSKKNIILKLMKDHSDLISKVECSIFIDDSDRHISDCSTIHQLMCLQPDWGYVTLNSRTAAQNDVLSHVNKLIFSLRASPHVA
jgi:hypothetical protein